MNSAASATGAPRVSRWGDRPAAACAPDGEQREGSAVESVALPCKIGMGEKETPGHADDAAAADVSGNDGCADGVAANPLPNLLPGILAQLSDPTIVKAVESEPLDTENVNGHEPLHLSREEAAALAEVPWEFRPHPNGIGARDGSHGDDEKDAGKKNPHVPSYSYLDLRAAQNTAWATSRLHAGVKYAKAAAPAAQRKAEACYREGLDLAPSHPELLVAHGALCANAGRWEEARESLGRAVDVTEGRGKAGENAREYLEAVERKATAAGAAAASSAAAGHFLDAHQQADAMISSTTAKKGLVSKTEYAMRDALAERAFLSEGTRSDAAMGRDEKYPLLEDPAIAAARAARHAEEDGSDGASAAASNDEEKHETVERDKVRDRHRDRKKSHRSRREDKRRRRHKHRHRSSRSERKHKLKRRRKMRDDDLSSSSEYSSSDESSKYDRRAARSDRKRSRRGRGRDYSSDSSRSTTFGSNSSRSDDKTSRHRRRHGHHRRKGHKKAENADNPGRHGGRRHREDSAHRRSGSRTRSTAEEGSHEKEDAATNKDDETRG